MRAFCTPLLVLLLACCSLAAIHEFDQRYGQPDPARYDHPTPTGSIDYWTQVNPLLEKRCVVCHGCYDAPCQLKLSAFEGIARGVSKQQVYNTDRLVAAQPTRLFEDANTVVEWRELGFTPVLNERENTAEANVQGSSLAQMLLLKQAHPLPDEAILPDSFDFSLDRKQQCAPIEKFEHFGQAFPLWGMPYGLPGLNSDEQSILLGWIAQGAPYQPRNRVTPELQAQIDIWERFFNGDSLKSRLTARYLYEHLFLAHLYFGGQDGAPVYFELVRSSTPPGQAPERIATRVPIADPHVDRVYYRLLPVRETITIKNHLPYRLDEQRLNLWNALFIDADYTVSSLPSYDPDVASNPFVTFADIPAESRYRFLLSEAQFTIMGFIKGPVCRGQVALDVINDYFWVFFTDPGAHFAGEENPAIADALKKMRLPAASGSNERLLAWLNFAAQEKKYREAKYKVLNDPAVSAPLNINLVWDGQGSDPNAALTVFRHFDNATVIKGLVGDRPQTAWVINYPLLERIHYLLVSGYDVFGNVGHQLNTRIYMDFLRMEGENNFLALLPAQARLAVHKYWYRGAVSQLEDYLNWNRGQFKRQTAIAFKTSEPLPELYAMLKRHTAAAENSVALPYVHLPKGPLGKLNTFEGAPLEYLPEASFLWVDEGGSAKPQFYTLVRHTAYTNISHLFGDNSRRLPAEDRMSVVPGLLGAYPNAFLRVNKKELANFASQIRGMQGEKDYRVLLDQYGVRRSNPEFWRYSDTLHEAHRAAQPIAGGLFDFDRLENR